jgi:xylulokinase
VGPKLLWLRRREPEVWVRTKRFFMASSYIIGRLTGAYVLDHHSASQCDPLYDLEASTWACDWASEVAPGLELPELKWSDEIAGRVTEAASLETGIPSGTPVATGTVDAWAEALSVGVRDPGDTMVMYGTTLFIVSVAARIIPHSAMWGTAGVSSGSRTFAAGMATSGALTAWFRDLVGRPSFEDLLADAQAAGPGANSLVVLPYFAGERTPVFDPDARGVIVGLTLRHGRGELYRALLESTAYGVRHILEAMEQAGAAPRRLIAVGGGTKGELWTQIVSDVTGRSQDIPSETSGAAYGDAMLAAQATGVTDASAWNRVDSVVDPDRSVAAEYEQLYEIYRSLYPATRDQAHALAEFQRSRAESGGSTP